MKFLAAAVVASAAIAVILAREDPVPSYIGQYGRECVQACRRNIDPVCAQNAEGRNRTYPNRCFVDYLNCRENNNYEWIADGECPDDPLRWQEDAADSELFARFDA